MHKYKDKYFSILGDSISTLEGYSEPKDAAFYSGIHKFEADVFSPKDTWWGNVIEHFEGHLLVNNSFLGSMVSKHPKCMIESYGCSDVRTSSLDRDGRTPDVIIVWLGTNDWGCGIVPTAEITEDLFVFSNAYATMLEKLKNNYPKSEILCFTLAVNKDKTDLYSYPVSEYCEQIRRVANSLGCAVIDIHKRLFNYGTIDGFHPNAKGMKTVADAVITEMESI